MERNNVKSVKIEEQMDESSVGIEVYVNSCKGFSGIVKQRFSDFIVREVTKDGRVLYLDNIDGSALEDMLFAEPEEEAAISSDSTDIINQLTKALLDLTKTKENEDFLSFISGCINKDPSIEKDFTYFPNLDKPTRTELHNIVRKLSAEFIDTTAVQVEGVSMIKFIAKHKQTASNRNKSKRRRSQWPSDLGNYLRFSLMKENVDTMSAANIINKNLRLTTGGLEYCGTKDKRAITIQKCTLYRKKPSDLFRINTYKYPPVIRIGDFEYCDEPAKLGDLMGNRFEIILRSLDKSDEIVLDACENLMKFGFINYFGLQRFGKGGTKSHFIGSSLFKSDWKECINMLFSQRIGDSEKIEKAKKYYLEGNYMEAKKSLPESMFAEKNVLDRLSKNSIDLFSAYNVIPKFTRLLCAHAYQSFLWNKAASYRIEKFGLNCIVGDLVALCGEDMDLSENVDEIILGKDEKMKEGDAVETSNNSFQRKNDKNINIHILNEEDIESNKFSIFDILLPLLGSETILPKNAVGEYLEQLLKDDGLTMDVFSTCHLTYRMSGAYRRVIQKPKDMKYSILPYSNPDEELAITELSKFRYIDETIEKERNHEEIKKEGSFQALKLEFTLPPGTYATMLLRELTKESTSTAFQTNLTAGHSLNGVEMVEEKRNIGNQDIEDLKEDRPAKMGKIEK